MRGCYGQKKKHSTNSKPGSKRKPTPIHAKPHGNGLSKKCWITIMQREVQSCLSHARRGVAASELIHHRIQTETPYSLNLVDEARRKEANVSAGVESS
jgi:hypothetical protein